MGQVQAVPISKIRENPVALRSVNKQTEAYRGLVASMAEKGFLGAIIVRPHRDPQSGQPTGDFELVDGLHRVTAARDVGIQEINVDIQNLDEDQVLEAQVLANIHKIETKPVEYTTQIRRILNRNPLMTEAELAKRLGKSTQWLKERLNLTKIESDEIKRLIDNGDIPLSNAYALAKLPIEEQPNYIQAATTQKPDEFIPAVTARAKEIRDAKRKGKDAAPAEFQPVAHIQKIPLIREQLEKGLDSEICLALMAITEIPKDSKKSFATGFNLAIKWVLNLDPKSIEAQHEKWKQNQVEKDAAKKRREVERQHKEAEKLAIKAKETAEAAAKAEEELKA